MQLTGEKCGAAPGGNCLDVVRTIYPPATVVEAPKSHMMSPGLQR